MTGLLWWLWRQFHPSCARCQPRIGTFPAESLCSAHRAEMERAVKEHREARAMQLGDDVKARYPEQWQQDAILQAWRTGKPVVGKPPK